MTVPITSAAEPQSMPAARQRWHPWHPWCPWRRRAKRGGGGSGGGGGGDHSIHSVWLNTFSTHIFELFTIAEKLYLEIRQISFTRTFLNLNLEILRVCTLRCSLIHSFTLQTHSLQQFHNTPTKYVFMYVCPQQHDHPGYVRNRTAGQQMHQHCGKHRHGRRPIYLVF